MTNLLDKIKINPKYLVVPAPLQEVDYFIYLKFTFAVFINN